jgi:ubiquinone biosynthesis protein Coq4
MFFKNKVLKDPVGDMLLHQKKCELDLVLSKHDYLKTLPKNTLGRVYYDYIQSMMADTTYKYRNYHELKSELYFTPKEKLKRRLISQLFSSKESKRTSLKFLEQLGVQHDIFHSLLGYGPNTDGELGVHAYQIHHFKIPAVKLIFIGIMIAQTIRTMSIKSLKIGIEGYRNGKKANRNLFIVDWKSHIEDDIYYIKNKYNILENKFYNSIYLK